MARKGNLVMISVRLEKRLFCFFPFFVKGNVTLQFYLVHLTFALAGLSGATLRVRVPWGRSTPISYYWVLRTIFLVLLGSLIRESLVSMNTGDGDLMDIIGPLFRKGGSGSAGPGGGLPDPSGVGPGPGFPVLADHREEDKGSGSPSWGALSPIEELPPLEGEQGLPT